MTPFVLDDVVLRWIEAYISGRVSRVHFGGEHSEAIPMHSCVPQGSVIGPRLFLIFLNDLQDVFEPLTLFMAHDVITVTPCTQKMNLHRSVTAAWDWSKKWELPINPSKRSHNWARRSPEIVVFSDGIGTPCLYPNWSRV